MADQRCALCLIPTDNCTGTRNRKRLHKPACYKEKHILNSFVSKRFPGASIYSFAELTHENAFLCSDCLKSIRKLKELEEQILKFSYQINSNIDRLHLAIPTVGLNQLSSSTNTSIHSHGDATVIANSSVAGVLPLQSLNTTSRPIIGQKRRRKEPSAAANTENSTAISNGNTRQKRLCEESSHPPITTVSPRPTATAESNENGTACQNSADTYPKVKVSIEHNSGLKKKFYITPTRKPSVTSLARRSYRSAATNVAGLNKAQDYTIGAISRRIHGEMNGICSTLNKSILRSPNSLIKQFSWIEIWNEFQRRVPTLTKLMRRLMPNANVRLLTFLIAMILKRRCKHMSFVQRALSVVLFGSGISKEVYRCLQPLMISMSSLATTHIIDDLCGNFDAEVLSWSSILKSHITPSEPAMPINIPDDEVDGEKDTDDDQDDDAQSCSSYGSIPIHEIFGSDDDEVITNKVHDSERLHQPDIHQCAESDCPQNQQEQCRIEPQLSDSESQVSQHRIEPQLNENETQHSQHRIEPQLNENETRHSQHRIEPQLDENETRHSQHRIEPQLNENETRHSQHRIEPQLKENEAQHSQLEQIEQQLHDIEAQHSQNQTDRYGYALVMDNVDKNVRPSYQRNNKGTKSYHFTHSYAVKNRIDISKLSDDPPGAVLSPDTILPNAQDVKTLKEEFEILVSRMLVQHMKEFTKDSKIVKWHIDSKYSTDMSTKSKVVPLGVQLKNEARIIEMCSILDAHNKFVPVHEHTEVFNCQGKEAIVDKSSVVQLLVFGDQLTVERIRGATSLRRTHRKALDSFKGFIPAVADWHARVCLLEVFHGRFYSSSSVRDVGSLFRLKHAINRTNVKADFVHNVKATEDFLLVVLCAYVITAAKNIMEDSASSCTSVLDMAHQIVSRYVTINLGDTDEDETIDMTYNHATDFLSLGLLWYGFHDAVKEGDGDRIIKYWKFLLPVFKEEGHHNYSKEAFNLIIQTQLLSPRKVAELKWNRSINTVGRRGCNIPCDLHMEHLNKRLKMMIDNLGANITPSSVQRVAKSLGVVHAVCANFMKDLELNPNKNYHTVPSFNRDLEIILTELEIADVFTLLKDRGVSLTYNKTPLLRSINWENITEWIKKKLISLDLTLCYQTF